MGTSIPASAADREETRRRDAVEAGRRALEMAPDRRVAGDISFDQRVASLVAGRLHEANARR